MQKRNISHTGPLVRAAAIRSTSSKAVANAPIQRTVWVWSAKNSDWEPKDPKKVYSLKPFFKTGSVDGEEYDDGINDPYEQSKDSTITPYLTGGDKFMGEKGSRDQLKGSKPKSEKIRVPAKTIGNRRFGSGMHEIVPTNLAPEIVNKKSLIAFQSGGRTSTDLTLFRRTTDKKEKRKSGTLEIGTHTGFAPKETGKGSTHTKGQAPAHDKLRKTARKSKSESDDFIVVNEMLNSHLDTQPTGPEIMESEYIEGMIPNISDIGKIGPVSDDPTQKDKERIKLAKEIHDRREKLKRRSRSLKREKKRGRSPSPPREPIDDSGSGGDYIKSPSISDEVEPIPTFKGKDGSFEFIANMSAWATQPQRYAPSDKIASVGSNKKRKIATPSNPDPTTQTTVTSPTNLTKRAPKKKTSSTPKKKKLKKKDML